MPFALYEAGGDDETFILVESTLRHEEIEVVARGRRERRIEQGIGPVQERRIVPCDTVEFPLHAQLDELLDMINEHNDLFPNHL